VRYVDVRLVVLGEDSPGVLAIGPHATGIFPAGEFATRLFAPTRSPEQLTDGDLMALTGKGLSWKRIRP
jgi:hypothetical protein